MQVVVAGSTQRVMPMQAQWLEDDSLCIWGDFLHNRQTGTLWLFLRRIKARLLVQHFQQDSGTVLPMSAIEVESVYCCHSPVRSSRRGQIVSLHYASKIGLCNDTGQMIHMLISEYTIIILTRAGVNN